jgi:hypothetical protein
MKNKKKKGKKAKWAPESFPQPRTYPSGWDSSALFAVNGERSSEGESREQADIKDSIDWKPEKFPKPRTFPKNWSIDD